MHAGRRPVEALRPAEVERPRMLAQMARVLRGDAARVTVTYLGATGAVTVGQVLAALITHG
jgi:hypothetical protein